MAAAISPPMSASKPALCPPLAAVPVFSFVHINARCVHAKSLGSILQSMLANLANCAKENAIKQSPAVLFA